MKTIKILIAASEELHAEKLEFTSLVEHLNQVLKPRGIELKRIKWDPENDGSIDAYQAKLRDCEMCLNLYWRNLSGNSEEELNTAYQQLKEGKNPRNLYVFFKEPANDLSEALRDFKANFVTSYGHFFCKFENVDTMNLHFILQFEAYQNRMDDSEGKLFKVSDGKVWLGDQDLVELGNVSFIAMNKEYRKLHDQISELRVKYAEIRAKYKMNPDDERIENEYLELNTKLNDASKEFEAYQQSLYDMELSFIEHSFELCSDRMIKARELFEQGDSVAADEILNLEEIEREDFNDEKLHKQILRKREQKIMEYVAKAKMVKLNRNYDYNEQTAIVCKVYDRAIGIAKEINYDEAKLVNILIDCASFLKEKFQHYKAIPYYEKALKIRKQFYSENSESNLSELVDTLENLAECRNNAGFFKSAERCFHEELNIFRLLAKDNPQKYMPEIARVLCKFGYLYKWAWNFEKAEKCYKEGLSIYEKLSANDPDIYTPYVASTYNSLSSLQDFYGHHEEAVRSIVLSIEIYKNLVQKKSNSYLEILAFCQKDLYKLLSRGGISEEAKDAFNETFATFNRLIAREKSYRSERYDLLQSYGLALSEEGRYEDAEKVFRKALRLMRSDNLYCHHFDLVAIHLGELANQLAKQGKFRSAVKYYREAFETRLYDYEKQCYDNYDGFLFVDRILKEHAALLLEHGHYNEAELLYLTAIGKGVRYRLRKQPLLFQAIRSVLLIDLSKLQYNYGYIKKSEQSFNKAIKASQTIVSKIADSEIHEYLGLMKMPLKCISERQKELGLFKDCLETYRTVVNLERKASDDLDEISMDHLADLYKEDGNFEEAKKIYLEELSVSFKDAEYDPEACLLCEMANLTKLAVLYRDFEHYKESEDTFLRILERNKTQLEENKVSFIGQEVSTLKDFALLKQKQGHYFEAKKLLNQVLIDYEQVKEMNYDFYNDKIAETQEQIEEIEEKLKAESS